LAGGGGGSREGSGDGFFRIGLFAEGFFLGRFFGFFLRPPAAFLSPPSCFGRRVSGCSRPGNWNLERGEEEEH
jgi:hypothetical protein